MTEFNPGRENGHDGRTDTELDDRDVRALTEYLTVVPEAPGLYSVTSQSGREYMIDTRQGRCTCDDHKYNLPTDDGRELCKHAARVSYETGDRPLPAWIDRDALPSDFAAHVDAEPILAATDGGSAEWTERADALDDSSDVVVAGDEGVILDDDPLPEITEHRESYSQGGAKYHRCEGCGRETIYGREQIPHTEECSRGE